MKPAPVEYVAPRSLEEALAILAENGDEAKVIAGGQSLVPLLSMRLARPAVIVDITGIDELRGISERDGGVAVRSATRERDAERSSIVAARIPVMTEALPYIGHVAIRNRGTIGGSIAHADASAELPAVATITGAEMVLTSQRGERVLVADEFFDGHFSTALDDDEILTEIRFPAGPPAAGWSFVEVARRHGDFALVGAAAMVSASSGRIDEARVCLIGVADRALRLPELEACLVGAAVGGGFRDAAVEAVAGLDTPSDIHGSAEYRRHLAAVTAQRALAAAAARSERRTS